MTETQEQRLARLTELARKVWPGFDGFHVASVDGKDEDGNHYPSFAEMRASTEKPRNREYWSLLHVDKLWTVNEARALEALEAALRVLTGEPLLHVDRLEQWLDASVSKRVGEVPPWAIALAEKWRRTRDSMEGTGQADALGVCADELLEAAKGKP